ncbi:MAG: Gx transporter family protein [Lachnospiraceae bacterium]|nr:Gx transporter family protein [Lachnospiraceae bacterium]MCR5086637.1 Gx transporter family protein [Lachnospiraceae bacterium]
MTLIAMLTAVAIVLMMFEFPVPFIPPFYKMDFSELPIIIGAFAMGPVAGVIMEFLKILLNLLFTGTGTAFVGEFANFIMGCCFIVPASILYYAHKTKKMSRIGLGVGCAAVTVCSCLLNAYLLLPTYGKLFHMDLDVIIGMGAEKNAGIKTLTTFIIYGVAPFNLIKYGLVSIVTIFIYKHISRLLKKQA